MQQTRAKPTLPLPAQRLLGALAIGLAGCSSMSAASSTAFWRQYEADKWTYCLFAFDSDLMPLGKLAEQGKAAPPNPAIRVSVWRTREGWAAAVTNWAKQAQAVTLRVDTARLPGDAVSDIETREQVGRAPLLALPVPARDYRLIYSGPALPAPSGEQKRAR